MSVMSVTWTLLRSPGMIEKKLDYMLGKWNQLCKSSMEFAVSRK